MIDNPYYSHEFHGDYELISIGRLDLEEGGSIPDCQLAVASFGELNQARDNAILIPTWYSGTHQIWRDVYIGPDHALNPERYFIVAINQIGSGLSTSPHNTPDGMANFPKVRISDDVRAQHRLLTGKFGLASLALVVGGSMGAQQTYEWAVRYPDMVRRAAPIAGTAKSTDHFRVFLDTMADTITSDPALNGGNYRQSSDVAAGLKRHARLWAVMGWSTEFYQQGRPAALGFPTADAFVDNFMAGYFAPMDPNDLLCMAWKCQHNDVSRITRGNLPQALGRIQAKTFVMPVDHDMFFRPRDCEAEQKLIPGSEFRRLHSIDGHLALFGTDPAFLAQVDKHLSELLATRA